MDGIIVSCPLKSKVSTNSRSGSRASPTLSESEQASVGRVVDLLVEHGPLLPWPHSSDIRSSRHRQMRELRIQHRGRRYRVLYAFDPTRAAILLLGGDKTGNQRWYEESVPRADDLYDEHLQELKAERRRGKGMP